MLLMPSIIVSFKVRLWIVNICLLFLFIFLNNKTLFMEHNDVDIVTGHLRKCVLLFVC